MTFQQVKRFSAKHEMASFAWDNEYDEFRRMVPEFRIQRYNVTNGEYLRFVEEGAAAPHFWVRRGDSFFYRGMFRRDPAAARLAGLRDATAGRGVCEMARERACRRKSSFIELRTAAHLARTGHTRGELRNRRIGAAISTSSGGIRNR